MTWEGQPYAPARPGEAIETGIGLIHQEMRLLPDLSIAENVFIGRAPHERGADRPRNHEQACVSSDLEEVIGLSHRVMVLARGRLQGTLKHGDATNVAIMELATR